MALIGACCLLQVAAIACTTRDSPGSAVAFDAAALTEAWVEAWNARDLDRIGRLFVTDSTLTYFSSERVGLIRGFDAVREHHAAMGFAPGGAAATAELWIENRVAHQTGSSATVTATWYYGNRAAAASELQHGPMTAVYVLAGNGYRIVHMHFSEYLPESLPMGTRADSFASETATVTQEQLTERRGLPSMPAYVIANITVTDAERYEDYKRLAGPSVAAYDGKYLVRGGTAEVLEGEWVPKRVVVLEFPSIARAKEWWESDSYTSAKGIRHQSAISELILVEGY